MEPSNFLDQTSYLIIFVGVHHVARPPFCWPTAISVLTLVYRRQWENIPGVNHTLLEVPMPKTHVFVANTWVLNHSP